MPEENENNVNETTETKIEPFVLPRLDWYDEAGRIYKDALIENFNALEAKLDEINQLSAFSSAIPDISQIHLDDVTLEDDDNKIINLRSFLTMFNLINYPIELTFSDKTIKKISYWNKDYQYITKEKINTKATEENKYIIYNFDDDTVTANSTINSIDENTSLIGVYLDGRIINLHSAYGARLNLMYLLGNMNRNVQNFRIAYKQDEHNFFFDQDGNGQKQQAGIRYSEKSSHYWSKTMTFLQQGRVD